MLDDHDVNARLSRLETIIDSISHSLEKIQVKLDSSSKINWAPIAIGVTIFFTVAGSISTIYNARISTINNAVETLATKTQDLEKGAVGDQLKLQVQDERLKELEKDVDVLQTEHRQHNQKLIEEASR
jgi:outer membrane murein-binding lipoprotein Lpp